MVCLIIPAPSNWSLFFGQYGWNPPSVSGPNNKWWDQTSFLRFFLVQSNQDQVLMLESVNLTWTPSPNPWSWMVNDHPNFLGVTPGLKCPAQRPLLRNCVSDVRWSPSSSSWICQARGATDQHWVDSSTPETNATQLCAIKNAFPHRKETFSLSTDAWDELMSPIR